MLPFCESRERVQIERDLSLANNTSHTTFRTVSDRLFPLGYKTTALKKDCFVFLQIYLIVHQRTSFIHIAKDCSSART